MNAATAWAISAPHTEYFRSRRRRSKAAVGHLVAAGQSITVFEGPSPGARVAVKLATLPPFVFGSEREVCFKVTYKRVGTKLDTQNALAVLLVTSTERPNDERNVKQDSHFLVPVVYI